MQFTSNDYRRALDILERIEKDGLFFSNNPAYIVTDKDFSIIYHSVATSLLTALLAEERPYIGEFISNVSRETLNEDFESILNKIVNERGL